jgi:thiaminase
MVDSWVGALARKAATFADSLERSPFIGRLVDGSASSDEYIRFLTGTYHYVSWSGRLLTMTAEGLRERGRYPTLVELLRCKSREESPHDQWALRDAEQCGADPDQLRGSAPNLAVEAYVSFGRAMASVGSPAYIGAAYVLEGTSLRLAGRAAQRLQARAAIPGIGRALSFLAAHAEADVQHVAALEDALCVVVDPADQAAILTSADVLSLLYPEFFTTPSPMPCAASAT